MRINLGKNALKQEVLEYLGGVAQPSLKRVLAGAVCGPWEAGRGFWLAWAGLTGLQPEAGPFAASGGGLNGVCYLLGLFCCVGGLVRLCMGGWEKCTRVWIDEMV